MVRARRGLLTATLGCVALAACATDATSSAIGALPTEVAVHPEDFLVGATCSTVPGSLQSYVVTLLAFDDAEDTEPFTLPSSQPTPCSLDFAMRDLVVAGKRYAAEIDGYDRPAAELAPFGGTSSGSRTMLGPDGVPVAPRWTSRCGAGAASATVAAVNQTSYVGACEALVDRVGSPTELRLSANAILDAEACVVTPSLELALLEGSAALPATLACDAGEVTVPVGAGVLVRFYARGVRPDGSPLGTECAALAAPGQRVTPACDPPSSHGAVRIAPALVKTAGACPKGTFYEVRREGGSALGPRLPCEVAAEVGPLEPGLVDLEVVTFDAKGEAAPGGATCKADVEPGRVLAATCL